MAWNMRLRDMSDDEFVKLYEEHGSTRKLGKAVGVAQSTVKDRLLRIKRGTSRPEIHAANQRRNPLPFTEEYAESEAAKRLAKGDVGKNSPNRSERRHISQYNDYELLQLWKDNGHDYEACAQLVGCGPLTFEQRIFMLTDADYLAAKRKAVKSGEISAFDAEEFEARGIDFRQQQIVQSTIGGKRNRWDSQYQGGIVPLKGDGRTANLKYKPRRDSSDSDEEILQKLVDRYRPEGRVIQYVDPVSVDKKTGEAKRTAIVGDVQIGHYWNPELKTLVPFHDLAAISVMLQMLRDFKPHEVVIIGDLMDLPSLSRWLQLPQFQITLQHDLRVGYMLLCQIRSIVGANCVIAMIAGNHERRLDEYIITNAKALDGIKPGWALRTDPEALSIVNLLGLHKLNISYSVAYPGGEYWISKNPNFPIVATHQGSLRAIEKMRATIVCGHWEERKITSATYHDFDGTHEREIIVVPGVGNPHDVTDQRQLSRTHAPSNTARKSLQQTFGAFHIFEEDGSFDFNYGRIKDGAGRFMGKHYVADPSYHLDPDIDQELTAAA